MNLAVTPSKSAMRASSRSRSFLIGFGVALAALYLFFLNPHLDVRSFNAHDPAGYLLGAESIWKGRGYGMQFAEFFVPNKIQPPGLSFILAPLVGLFGMHFAILKLFLVGLSALMAWAGFLFFRHFLGSSREAALASLLLMSSPVIFGLSHQVMAEIPLVLCVVLALRAADRWLLPSERLLSPFLWATVGWTAGAFFFKALGLAVLLGSWLLLLHPRRRAISLFKKLLLYTALALIPIGWWAWQCRMMPSIGFYGGSMLDWYVLKDATNPSGSLVSLTELLIRMRHNLVWGMSAAMASSVAAPLFLIRHSLDWIACLLALPILLGMAWQWWCALRNEPSVLEGFTGVGLAMVLLYSLGYAERYVAFAYPALIVYALRGFKARLREPWRYRLPLVVLSMAVSIGVAANQRHDPYGSPLVRDYVALGEEAKRYFPPQSRCLAPMEAHWQVLTGHRCWVKEETKTQGLTRLPFDYAVVLKDPLDPRLKQTKDFERDVIQSAWHLTQAAERQLALTTVYENETFRLAKRSQR